MVFKSNDSFDQGAFLKSKWSRKKSELLISFELSEQRLLISVTFQKFKGKLHAGKEGSLKNFFLDRTIIIRVDFKMKILN